MGLKEAHDSFLKAHGELVREMGQEVDRISDAVAAIDEELEEMRNLLECKNNAHAQYELEMFRQVQAASKDHDDQVLQISQKMELKRKEKMQLSKSLQSLLQTSLANLCLPDIKPPTAVALQASVLQAGEQDEVQQPDSAAPPNSVPAGGEGQEQAPAAAAPAVTVKPEPVVQAAVGETQPEKDTQPDKTTGWQPPDPPKGRKPGRKKKGVVADTPGADPDSSDLKRRRGLPEAANGSPGRTPGTGRYFLRQRTPLDSPTTGPGTILLT